jgi:hypothetical protein
MSSGSYECLLHGIINTEGAKDSLLRRLVGMCGKDSQLDLFEHQIGFIPTGAYHITTIAFKVDTPISRTQRKPNFYSSNGCGAGA